MEEKSKLPIPEKEQCNIKTRNVHGGTMHFVDRLTNKF